MSPTGRQWLRDLPWVGPLTLFVLLGTGFAVAGHDSPSGADWWAIPVAGAASAVLLVGRSWPIAALVLPTVVAATYFAVGFVDGPIYLAVYAGAFVAARALPVAAWLPAAAVSGAALLAGLAVRALRADASWTDRLPQALASLALAVSAAAVGSLVRSRQQTAAERTARAATEERLRMAQDLHDGVGHGLAVIAMQAGVALHVLEREPASARRALEAIRDTSRESLDALRVELLRLSGAPPGGARRGIADLDALVDRLTVAGLEVSVEGADLDVSDDVGHTAYLVVQEALTNVLRHSSARSVVVRLSRSEAEVRVSVTDDGAPVAGVVEGLGLAGMRHRVSELGGTVRAGARPDGGFEVRAEIPL